MLEKTWLKCGMFLGLVWFLFSPEFNSGIQRFPVGFHADLQPQLEAPAGHRVVEHALIQELGHCFWTLCEVLIRESHDQTEMSAMFIYHFVKKNKNFKNTDEAGFAWFKIRGVTEPWELSMEIQRNQSLHEVYQQQKPDSTWVRSDGEGSEAVWVRPSWTPPKKSIKVP